MGVSSVEIGKVIGCLPATVRQRAHRYGWVGPKNIREKSKELALSMGVPAETGRLEQAAATIEQIADRHRSTMASKVAEKAARAAEKLPPPKTWKDLDVADKLVRRSTGLDSDQPPPVVNIGVLGGGVIDLDAID